MKSKWVGGILAGITILLTAGLAFGQSEPDFPERIAYASNTDNDFEIYLMEPDGNIFAKLTDNRATDITPSWSPDGSSIAYASNVGGDFEIYVVDVDTGESVNLTNNGADDLYPAWSPDGSLIAFTTNRNLNWEIYTMNPDGTNLVRLTHSDFYEGNPAWSPDSSQIAFVYDRDDRREIRVMDADGSNVRELTDNNVPDFSPAWSPDGTQIAFVSKRVSNRSDTFLLNVACMNVEGECETSAVNVTAPEGGVDPAWSPDGTHLIFSSGRDGTPSTPNTDLYSLLLGDEDISQAQRLTTAEGDDRFPAWWSASAGETGA